MSACASSMPNPMARNEDVIMLTHRISRGESGKTELPSASLNAKAMSKRITCAMFEMSRCNRN